MNGRNKYSNCSSLAAPTDYIIKQQIAHRFLQPMELVSRLVNLIELLKESANRRESTCRLSLVPISSRFRPLPTILYITFRVDLRSLKAHSGWWITFYSCQPQSVRTRDIHHHLLCNRMIENKSNNNSPKLAAKGGKDS